jgi:D-alanyl-D-alanine carboxypeptidase (penicillin-binding protein 5/6)
MAYSKPARTPTRRIRIRRIRVAGLLVGIAAIAASLGYQLLASSSSTDESPIDVLRSEQRGAPGEALPSTVWPVYGQAAFVLTGHSQVQAGPNQHAAPIASVAKVMTAYLVLRDHPLLPGQDGPTITLTDADVADTDRRRRREESVVSIAAGEELTERQALQALLLPSANNIAAVLSRWDAGSADRFVARMNGTARSLGMTHTRYTDPSGYDDATVSTAADQVRLVDRAMRLPVFASIVATPSATLPVAGTVHNTNTLLGHNGFVGVKTGSDDAAGGCFAFRAIRWIDGKRTTITGVVLGQPGDNQISAGLAAANAMVDRIAGQRLRHRGKISARPEWTGGILRSTRDWQDSSDAVRVAGGAGRGSGGAVRPVGGSGCRAHGCLHGARSHGPGRIRAPLVQAKSRRDGDRQSDRRRRRRRWNYWIVGRRRRARSHLLDRPLLLGQGGCDLRPQCVLDC